MRCGKIKAHSCGLPLHEKFRLWASGTEKHGAGLVCHHPNGECVVLMECVCMSKRYECVCVCVCVYIYICIYIYICCSLNTILAQAKKSRLQFDTTAELLNVTSTPNSTGIHAETHPNRCHSCQI
jgi:hypothetical protein